MKKWTLTDADTQQYGRKLSEWVYEFKQTGKDCQTIDLSEYSAAQVEEIINSYGYTLEPWPNDTFIFDIYHDKETVNWIIAECIFEYE